MPKQTQIVPEKANPTGGVEPRASRRAEAHSCPAPAELLNQVEADLRGESGVLRFSEEVERRFQLVRDPGYIRNFVRSSLIGLLLYDLFLVPDRFMVPDVFVRSGLIHLVVTLLDLVVILLIHRRVAKPTSLLGIMLLVLGNVMYTATASHASDATFIPFIIPLLAVYVNIVLPLPFRDAAAFSLCSAVAVIATVSLQQGLDTGARIFVVLLEAGMALCSLVATYRIEGGERQAYLLALREALRGETLVEENRELSELSETDQLTGIPNRRVFDRNLEQLWKEHQQSRTPLALLIIDIDHFKRLNDTHGHINGDVCLHKVADRLCKLMQAHQSLARYGGEEFAVLLEGEGAYRAEAVAERLRNEIEVMPIVLEGTNNKPHRITISIGCATVIPRSDLGPAQLFVAADKALYTAKHKGRNRVCTQSLESEEATQNRDMQNVLPTKSERHPKTSAPYLGLIG